MTTIETTIESREGITRHVEVRYYMERDGLTIDSVLDDDGKEAELQIPEEKQIDRACWEDYAQRGI